MLVNVRFHFLNCGSDIFDLFLARLKGAGFLLNVNTATKEFHYEGGGIFNPDQAYEELKRYIPKQVTEAKFNIRVEGVTANFDYINPMRLVQVNFDFEGASTAEYNEFYKACGERFTDYDKDESKSSFSYMTISPPTPRAQFEDIIVLIPDSIKGGEFTISVGNQKECINYNPLRDRHKGR